MVSAAIGNRELSIVVVFLSLSACSFIGARTHARPVAAHASCVSALPYLDGAVALASPFPMIALATLPCASDGQEGCGYSRELGAYFVGVPALAVGVVAAVSMLYGAHVADTCRSRRAETRAIELAADSDDGVAP